MDSEDMDHTVSSIPGLYDDLKGLGVSASVWDDVLDELFDEPFGNIPGPFGFLLMDLSGKIGIQRFDYSRPEGISDHDYVRGLFRQVTEYFSDDPQLPNNEGDCDEAIAEYWAENLRDHASRN